MKRTMLLLILIMTVALFGFAGGSAEEASEDGVTIDYAFWGNPEAIGVEQDIIEAYHTAQDEIRVSPLVSGYADYHSMLLTQLAGGTGPDVMRIDSYYFQDFVELNALQPIDEMIARDGLDVSGYYQQGIEENTFDGKLYGLPWATAPLYMFINLDVFDAAGVDLPDYDWTLEDFERIARELTGDGTYGYAIDMTPISMILPFVWANGGDIFSPDRQRFTLNEPAAVEALEWLAGLYREGIMPEDTVSADAEMITRWFINNRLAMRMGSAAEILTKQAEGATRFEVMNMPTGAGGRDTTVFKSNIIGINARSQNVEAAWNFIKFLRGPEKQGEELYMKAQRMPPTFDDDRLWGLYADPDRYPRMVEQNTSLIAEQYGRLMPLRRGWLEVEDLVMPEVQGILTGDVGAQEAMNSIAADAQRVLDR